ncbi:MAG: hypothetical protein PHN51_06510 [Candidatus Nanopelagicales bacterium]|nr:hypothetical protein [Candidatus Nanopelagicales bacterium]
MTSAPTIDQLRKKHLLAGILTSLKIFTLRKWSELDAEPNDRRVSGTATVAVVAFILVMAAASYSIRSGWNLALGDAQAHLTIARRVTDSLAPGFPQLGTVWLPIPHLLLLPLVQSTFIWHTGWAGAILGAVALAGTSAALYRICARVGIKRAGRVTAVALLLLNSTIIYLCTTAMAEPVLMMWLVASVAGMTRWAMSSRELSAGEMMVFSGLPAAAALMSRYEGWALVIAGTAVAAVLGWRRKPSRSHALKIAGAYALWPAMAAFWWLIYNFAVYGNPLEFATGQYSASALQAALVQYGVIAYQGSLGMTVWTYFWAVMGTVGVVPILIGIIGIPALAWTRGLRNDALMIWLLAVPSAFIIVAMYAGQTAMSNTHSLPEGLWNYRYAISSLPFFAVLGAMLIQLTVRFGAVRKYVIALVSLLILLQAAWWVMDFNHSGVIAEASVSITLKEETRSIAMVQYLRDHYDGGRILMDENAGGNSLLPQIGIPLSEYFNVSTGSLFKDALKHPASHARWVEFIAPADSNRQSGSSDSVFSALANNPEFLSQYALVFNQGNYRIYRRISS